ncbi:MAG: hypothetical protein AW09_002431 [Candidatus Accumulibacter phosphatis]|uniref:Uncharacterized protein n=1 Tax=Candidatus Accumulibacter phosphatis TaxID=327160 RepID=A0A080LUZ0_9PROT|nr:MAG: hypothetical protein AW09_002431 [Candidatus Accumulibacter phosphatis]
MQFVGDHLQWIVGELLDVMACAGEFVEFPSPVAAGAPSPRHKKTLCSCRVSPGGQAMIKMCREMANQGCLQRKSDILTRQMGEQCAQRPFVAETVEQFLPNRHGSGRRGLGASDGGPGSRPAQGASRCPEVGDGCGLIVAVRSGGVQQSLPHERVEIRLQALARRFFLDLPAQTGR